MTHTQAVKDMDTGNFFREFSEFVGTAMDRYEKLSPVVYTHLDDLYMRMQDAPESVSVLEVSQVSRLLENGEWEPAHAATNRIVKVRERCGLSIAGMNSF